jgi:G3E family GTPase
MDLILLTGFLGAGKTTLLNHLLEQIREQSSNLRVGIIVNEFGKSGIDGRLVREPGVDLMELNNGSVFCACIREKFIFALESLAEYDLDLVLVEASGLSDPSNIGTILDTVHQRKGPCYTYRGSVCVLDAGFFLQQVEILPVIRRQIECSSVVIINKLDKQDSEQLQAIRRQIAEIHGKAVQIQARYCRVDLKKLMESLLPLHLPPIESLNTVENRPRSFVLTTDEFLLIDDARRFLDEIIGSAYRIKGFIRCMEGVFQVSSVNKQLEVTSWDRNDETTELVVISSVGVMILRIFAETQKKVWERMPFRVQ